eukprot:1157056-Pelagomonas_calceolata.AAC.2
MLTVTAVPQRGLQSLATISKDHQFAVIPCKVACSDSENHEWKVVGPRFMYQCERRCIKVQSMPISHAGAHKQTQNIMGSEGSEGRMAS